MATIFFHSEYPSRYSEWKYREHEFSCALRSSQSSLDFCHPPYLEKSPKYNLPCARGEKGECERHSSDWSEQERVNKSKPCIPKFVVRIRIYTNIFVYKHGHARVYRVLKKLRLNFAYRDN